jgi:carbon starvation protein CstA
MLTNYADAASLVVGLALPAIVALFTRPSTNATVKGAAHAVLAVATGFWAVYQAHPQHFYWAPAVVASFLTWVTGTAFYHSLLKKYSWFSWLQNSLITETENRLHISPATLAKYVEETEAVEPPAQVSGATLSPEAIEQIAVALHAALQRAVKPALVAQETITTQALPQSPLGPRSV